MWERIRSEYLHTVSFIKWYINRIIATNRLQFVMQIDLIYFVLVQTNLQVNLIFMQINKFPCRNDSCCFFFPLQWSGFYIVCKSHFIVQMLPRGGHETKRFIQIQNKSKILKEISCDSIGYRPSWFENIEKKMPHSNVVSSPWVLRIR